MPTFFEWPTPFYIGEVADQEKIRESLISYIDNDDYFEQAWSLSNCKTSCQSANGDQIPFDVFVRAIQPNLLEYFESLAPTEDFTFEVDEVWLNVYNKNEYQEIHDHSLPGRSFACSYILDYPTEKNSGGELVIENTDFGIIQMSGLERVFNVFNQSKFIPKLKNGLLIIFPCWAKHYVLANKSENKRVTVSANIKINSRYTK